MASRFVKSLKVLSVMCTLMFIIFTYSNVFNTISNENSSSGFEYNNMIPNSSKRKKSFTKEEVSKMSELGRWLISPEGSPPPAILNLKNTPHLILIWKNGPFLERRHIKRFSTQKFSPWENCSVQCLLSYKSSDLEKADSVLFHLHRTKDVNELPSRRNYNQRWIFLTDESPLHTFMYGNQKLSDYNKFFNWTMTYRMDSDIPVPYGRTILSKTFRSQSLFHSELKNKNKLVAIMGSNCAGSNGRWNYIRELKLLLGKDLDIYGHCLNGDTTSCPGHFNKDCKILEEYKFYLAFENSNCREYLTEKVFWNGYKKFAIPVIMGAPREDSVRLLPPNSFLHVSDFSNPSSLANYLKYLHKNYDAYLKLHEWRSRYVLINEHGYFGSRSQHYCRICEALHYNSMDTKVYDNLENFWSKKRDCFL